MRFKWLFFTICMIAVSPAFSQGLDLGIKGGVNMGKLTGKAFKEEFTFGYQLGAFATVSLGGRVALQPEVLFTQTNLDTASRFSEIYEEFNDLGNVKLNMLTIPVLLNINLGRSLALQAGPQFGIVVDQNKNLLQNGQDAFKSGDFALVGGLQLSLARFNVYGRFVSGLTNLDNVGNRDTWKTEAIQLGVGLKL